MSWPMMRLGDAVTFKGGGTPSRDVPAYWNGPIPWATVKDLKSGYALRATQESITAEGLRRSASNLIPAGSVVIPTRMALGKAVITELDVAINQDLKAVLPNEKVDPRFLMWFFVTNRAKIESMGKGATVKGVTLDQLAKLPFQRPPLHEQRRIAAILDKADALRAKRREAITKLDQLLQSVFLDMFGDPVTNPKGWTQRELIEICDPRDRVNYGVVQPGDQVDGGVHVVRVGDIAGGQLSAEKIKRISAEIEANYIRSRLKGNELLVSCVGSIGVVAEVPAWAIGFNVARALTRVPLVNKEVRPFVREMLRSSGVQRYFAEKTRTVSQPTLNVEFVKAATVIDPPSQLVEQFCAISRQADLMHSRISAGEIDVSRLFSAVQKAAFSGNL